MSLSDGTKRENVGASSQITSLVESTRRKHGSISRGGKIAELEALIAHYERGIAADWSMRRASVRLNLSKSTVMRFCGAAVAFVVIGVAFYVALYGPRTLLLVAGIVLAFVLF